MKTVKANYGAFNNLSTNNLTTTSLRVNGPVFVPIPKFVDETDYTVQDADYIIICTRYDDFYLTLPDAATCPGRSLIVRSNTGYYTYSNDNNVAMPGCGDKYSAINDYIVYDYYQAWAEIVSDGTYWVIVNGYGQAYCD